MSMMLPSIPSLSGSGLSSWTTISLISIATLLVMVRPTRLYQFLWFLIFTGARDLKLKRSGGNVITVFREHVKKTPDKVVIIHQDTRWTFHQLDLWSNKVGNMLTEQGFKPGDEVAFMVESSPQYIGFWLGAAKVGVIPALINTNQMSDTLVHSITVIKCKGIFFGHQFLDTICQVESRLKNKLPEVKFYCLRGGVISNGGTDAPTPKGCYDLDRLIDQSSSDASLIKHIPKFTDRLFYIYTSGTTGLPKAAIIKHARYIWIGSALRNLSGVSGPNTIYTCIPLYHLSGGVLGTNQCLIWGDTMVLRHKFSASSFWTDCIKYECNMAQYIGEICRYLMAQPPKPSDKEHKVRFIFGNGLRPELWTEFVDRFNIGRVGEFYGSTEGNANIINNSNQPGACGFISQILPTVYPVSLIKVDEDTHEPVRGSNGLCIRVKPGDYGEFIGKIVLGDASRAFDGYVDESATKKKIIRDVYAIGDMAFLSGDILKMDSYGFVYFKDRTGDTFRWKGENVSTTEVEAVISNILTLKDCVVYGVEVSGCEGKSGMAAIVDNEDTIDFTHFVTEMRKKLPTFAIPNFVRLVQSLESTSTYKLPKSSLQREGYNLNIVKDPIFMLDAKQGTYIKLDKLLLQQLQDSSIRL